MLHTVRLTGLLARKYGDCYRLDLDTPAEAIRALSCQIEGFARDVARGAFYLFDGRRNIGSDALSSPFGAELVIVPAAAVGKNGGALKLIAGVALFAVGFATGGAAIFAGITGKTLMTLGAGMALNGAAQMLSPSPPAIDAEPAERRQSYLFNGGANPTEEGNVVPLAYGRAVWCNALNVSMDLITTEEA